MIINDIDTKIDNEHSQFFRVLETISNSDIYQKYTPELSYQHKLGHIQKVLLFSQIIAQNEKLEKNYIKILLTSAAFHDCGRIKDRDNGEHGLSSAKIAGKYFRENIKNQYEITLNEIGVVQSAIEYHVIVEQIPGQIDELKLKEICYKYNVNIEEFDKVKLISAILKDADALDRTRFISGSDLNSNFLRTKTAKKQVMIEFAKKINEEYANQVINVNYNTVQNIFASKVKLLHCIRHKYKIENGGIHIKEIDVPLNIIKTIFYGTLLDREYIVDNVVYSKCEEESER